ncbi:hypothetical protein D3C87_803550 [compost metagenome]
MRKGLGEVGEADELQRFVDAPALRLEHAARLQAERHVVPHAAPGVERRVLEDDDARRVGPRDGRAVLGDASGGGGLQPGHEAQQRRLAAAARPEQRDELAGLHREVDVVEHLQRTRRHIEPVAHALDVDLRAGLAHMGFNGGYHFTVPFCHDSTRSRTLNSSVIRPEHSSAITISAAYMFEYEAQPCAHDR